MVEERRFALPALMVASHSVRAENQVPRTVQVAHATVHFPQRVQQVNRDLEVKLGKRVPKCLQVPVKMTAERICLGLVSPTNSGKPIDLANYPLAMRVPIRIRTKSFEVAIKLREQRHNARTERFNTRVIRQFGDGIVKLRKIRRQIDIRRRGRRCIHRPLMLAGCFSTTNQGQRKEYSGQMFYQTAYPVM